MRTRIDSSRVDLAAREAQAIGFLETVPEELKPVLIGGYAVAAYGAPRFSVDVDLVLPAAAGPGAIAWFKSSGVESRKTFSVQHGGETWSKLRIHRDLLSGDIYLGGLQARASLAQVGYDWLSRKPTMTRLVLTTTSTRRPVRVARAEAIWALKLLAGRPQDLTDLFAISAWPMDPSEVRSKLQSLLERRVHAQLERVGERLSRDVEYRDALSRRAMGRPTDPRNQRVWSSFKKLAFSCLPG